MVVIFFTYSWILRNDVISRKDLHSYFLWICGTEPPETVLCNISPESWLIYCIQMHLLYNNKLGITQNNSGKHIVFVWFYIIIVNSILSE